MEDTIRGVRFGILPNASSGEGSVTDIHRKEQVIDRLFAVHGKHHMLRFMLDDSPDEAEEVVDVVRAYVVFERLGLAAAERIDAEADRVDEIAVVLDIIAPIGDAAYVDRMSFALKETAEGLLVILGQIPIPAPIVACSARHESHLNLGLLLGRKGRTHDPVDGFGECSVAAEDEYLVISFLHEFARQFDGMSGELGDTIGEGHMPATQEVPQVDTLCTEGLFAGFGVDDNA